MSIKIRIVSDFDKRGLTDAEKALNGLSKAAGIALAAVGAAVAGIAVKSVQEFAKFDAALTQSKAIMGDLTETMEKDMADAAREIAKVTTFSAEEAAQSFFYLASAGLDAEASIAALPRVAQFAQAGMFDMSRATDLLTDAQSALGLTIRDDAVANMENMIKVSDVLVRANTLSNATVEQFSTSLTTKAGPALRALGKDVEEGVAVLAAFADQGIKGEEAGTQLSIVLRDLSTKAIKNKEEFAKFGVSVFDTNGEMRNLGDIVANLEDTLAGMSDETRKATLLQLGFSDKSVSAMMALLGTSDAIKAYETELRSATGFTDEVANKQLETFNSQMKLLESAFIDVAIQIGEELTPYLQDLIPVIQELLPVIGQKIADAIKKVDWEKLIEDVANFITLIVENIDTIAKIAETILIAAAALVTYRIATKAATAAQALFNSTLLLNPWGLLITGLALATAGFVQYADELYGSKVNTEGMTDAQAEQATQLERLRKLQEDYRRAIESSDAPNEYYEAQLRAIDDTIARVEYSLQTTSGELNRFNNLRLDSVIAQANAAREAFAAMTFTGTGGTADWLNQMFGTGPSAAKIPIDIVTPKGPSVFDQTRDRVQKLIKNSQKQLADAQKQYNKTVQEANEDYAVNVEKLQVEYANRLENIIQQSQDRLRNAYKSAVETNIASLFERDEAKSVEGLVQSLSDKLTASRNLLSNSAQLASAGFSQTFIEQVVGAGTETGNELASAILNSTPEVQGELKSLFQALEIESTQGMDALASEIYERQGLATQALVDLYAKTQADQANAMIDLQTRLDETLLNAADTLQENIKSIKENVLEQISEMDSSLGGLGKTVEQFIGKLDSLIQKRNEVAGLSMDSFTSTTADGLKTIIGYQGPPTTQPYTPPVETKTEIHLNVKTDVTQSPAMVGSALANAISKYTTKGGGISGFKVIAV